MERTSKSDQINKKLITVLIISVSIFVFQIIGGIISNSIALIADSFHLMIDFSAITITLFAFRIANRPHMSDLTFGFHRAEVLAAFVNGMLLLAMSGIIMYEAYERFLHPAQINIQLLLVFAFVGLTANVVMALILKTEGKTNLNVRGSYLHVMGDLISSVGVVAGALIMLFSNFLIIDVIISLGISVLIAHSGIRLCKNCTHIFMEGVPEKIRLEEIRQELESFEEITDVHDLHLWALTSNLYTMSVHVKVKVAAIYNINDILKKINQVVREKFGITHCTIQVENECDLIMPDGHEQ